MEHLLWITRASVSTQKRRFAELLRDRWSFTVDIFYSEKLGEDVAVYRVFVEGGVVSLRTLVDFTSPTRSRVNSGGGAEDGEKAVG